MFTDTVESDARLVFSDVVDEFCSIRGVASRFENWRTTDSDAYREAYVSMFLPKVLGPLVRLKMLMWNPLQVRVTEFIDEFFMAVNIWIVVFLINTAHIFRHILMNSGLPRQVDTGCSL
jgi:hypothetical protein